jgi:hypothetical protein
MLQEYVHEVQLNVRLCPYPLRISMLNLSHQKHKILITFIKFLQKE